MEQEQSGNAIAAFRHYAQAFQSLDPKAVAQHFNRPSLLIAPQRVLAFSTAADVEQAYAHVMAELPARGYSRTEFSPLVERRLSEDLAVVTGRGVWKTATGDELSHFGLTYTLRRSGEAWHIVVAAIHESDVKQ
jgi:ketosteroid isomerase-like protein